MIDCGSHHRIIFLSMRKKKKRKKSASHCTWTHFRFKRLERGG